MEIVALFVSISALLLSAASLWHSSLKPAEIVCDQLLEQIEIPSGGQGDIPAIFVIKLGLVVSNDGARAGLLKSIELSAVAKGEPRFVTGRVSEPRHETALTEAGVGAFVLPRTIESGDVRSLEIRGELDGPFRTEAGTTYLETPDRKPLAELLVSLTQVDVQVTWWYVRRGLFKGRRATSGSTTVTFPARLFRGHAALHWEDVGRSDLRTIALVAEPYNSPVKQRFSDELEPEA